MVTMQKILLYAAVSISLFVGAFIYLKPFWAIEIQKKFYEIINWRIEPISLEKEIRNTKIMGLFLMIFVVATLFSIAFYK